MLFILSVFIGSTICKTYNVTWFHIYIYVMKKAPFTTHNPQLIDIALSCWYLYGLRPRARQIELWVGCFFFVMWPFICFRCWNCYKSKNSLCCPKEKVYMKLYICTYAYIYTNEWEICELNEIIFLVNIARPGINKGFHTLLRLRIGRKFYFTLKVLTKEFISKQFFY